MKPEKNFDANQEAEGWKCVGEQYMITLRNDTNGKDEEMEIFVLGLSLEGAVCLVLNHDVPSYQDTFGETPTFVAKAFNQPLLADMEVPMVVLPLTWIL